MRFTDAEVWGIIAALGVGTFVIRFSFLGLIGSRKMPDWVLRHLRYTPVAVLPGLVAPLVLFPSATDGQIDPPRLLAAAATVAVAYWTKNILAGAAAGAVTLAVALQFV